MTTDSVPKDERADRTCRTCTHRDTMRPWQCSATGMFCNIEKKYGGACGQDFKLWSPRPGLFIRLFLFFWRLP
jgi:hypothetical protein